MARLSRHVSGESSSIDLSLPARRQACFDLAGINKAPHRVGADAEKLGRLSDPQVTSHTCKIANAGSGGRGST